MPSLIQTQVVLPTNTDVFVFVGFLKSTLFKPILYLDLQEGSEVTCLLNISKATCLDTEGCSHSSLSGKGKRGIRLRKG